MTRKEITSIALKVFALYLIANILYALPTAYILLNAIRRLGDRQTSQLWLGGISVCFVVIGVFIAFILWKLANSLIASPEGNNYHDESSLSTESLEPVILSSVGAFIAISTLQHLGQIAANSLNYAAIKGETGNQISNIVNITSDLIALGLGVSLIIKSKWWINLFKKFR